MHVKVAVGMVPQPAGGEQPIRQLSRSPKPKSNSRMKGHSRRKHFNSNIQDNAIQLRKLQVCDSGMRDAGAQSMILNSKTS